MSQAHHLLAVADEVLRQDGQGLTLGQLQKLETLLGDRLAGDLRLVQAVVSAWQRATFGTNGSPAHVMGMHKKLEEEGRELMLALAKDGYQPSEHIAEELADNMILILGLFAQLKLDALAELERKMAINKSRTWPKPVNGEAVRHLGAGSAA